MEHYDDPTTVADSGGESQYAKRKRFGRIATTCEFDARTYARLEARRDVEERSLGAIVRDAVRRYCDEVEAADRARAARIAQIGDTGVVVSS